MICNRDDKGRNERKKNVDTDKIYTLHLFAGAGGGILGDLLLGHIPVGAVEIEAYPRKVLLARQLDGSIPRFPIWDDVCTFRSDNQDCAEYIERLRRIRDRLCICGGFPCQDISSAGKGAGLDGQRSGLWSEMRRIIGEVRPRFVFVENSPAITFRGLGRVLGDLAEMGFDARWGVLGADAVGADHHRARFWLVADADVCRFKERWWSSKSVRFEPTRTGNYRETIEHPLLGMDDGLADWVDRQHAIGNGQVPAVVSLAWETLS